MTFLESRLANGVFLRSEMPPIIKVFVRTIKIHAIFQVTVHKQVNVFTLFSESIKIKQSKQFVI